MTTLTPLVLLTVDNSTRRTDSDNIKATLKIVHRDSVFFKSIHTNRSCLQRFSLRQVYIQAKAVYSDCLHQACIQAKAVYRDSIFAKSIYTSQSCLQRFSLHQVCIQAKAVYRDSLFTKSAYKPKLSTEIQSSPSLHTSQSCLQ